MNWRGSLAATWAFALGVIACRTPAGSAAPPPVVANDGSATPTAPVAPREPVTTTLHGTTLVDPYAWLRNRDDPRVRAYVEAENRYAEAVLAPTKALRETVLGELRARIIADDTSVPVPWGDWEYFERVADGQEYDVSLRRPKGDLDPAHEQVVLDANARAAGHDHYSVGAFAISPDHRRIAWTEDLRGDERYRVFVADIATGALQAQFGAEPAREGEPATGDIGGELVWANDGHTLFYSRLDEAHRDHQIWRVDPGQPERAELVLEEPDAQFSLSIWRSLDDAWLFVASSSQITSEVRFVPARRPSAPWRMVEPRRRGIEYQVAPQGDALYVLTNDGAPEFALKRASLRKPGRAHWRTVAQPDPGASFDGLEVLADHVVVSGREGGLPQVWIFDRKGEHHTIAWPDVAYDASVGTAHDYRSHSIRLRYSSPVTPDTVFDYDLAIRKLELRKRDAVPQFEPSRYELTRLEAPTPDGVRVPITLVRRRDAPRPAPLYLQGYGAYGSPYEASFDDTALPLLDRGVAVAIAHVRGGGELGRAWYEAGKLAAKHNTFDDFVTAAEFLVEHGDAARGRIAIEGGSAGGLLIGAVVTRHPELFRVAVADVPFVDVINTMRDASLPLTAGEWDEWGNPELPEQFAWMMAYSPYDNVRAQRYPDMLVLAGWNDPRVGYWEPAKWVAKLRAQAEHPAGSQLLLRTEMDAGHSGASGRYASLEERALVEAFVLDRLGSTSP